jgi:EAL domain-containing protein (putative c-di-GMP-specific phosphodiesterase class I)
LLRGLPIQVVKIDKSLVSACGTKRECAAIVQAATAMSHAMGIRVVAEGIETAEQRRTMAQLGCDAGQGYFFAHPQDYAGLREAITRAVAEHTFTA